MKYDHLNIHELNHKLRAADAWLTKERGKDPSWSSQGCHDAKEELTELMVEGENREYFLMHHGTVPYLTEHKKIDFEPTTDLEKIIDKYKTWRNQARDGGSVKLDKLAAEMNVIIDALELKNKMITGGEE